MHNADCPQGHIPLCRPKRGCGNCSHTASARSRSHSLSTIYPPTTKIHTTAFVITPVFRSLTLRLASGPPVAPRAAHTVQAFVSFEDSQFLYFLFSSVTSLLSTPFVSYYAVLHPLPLFSFLSFFFSCLRNSLFLPSSLPHGKPFPFSPKSNENCRWRALLPRAR